MVQNDFEWLGQYKKADEDEANEETYQPYIREPLHML